MKIADAQDLARERDKQDKEEMTALGVSLLDFLERPPKRCRSATQIVLLQAMGMLKADVDALEGSG